MSAAGRGGGCRDPLVQWAVRERRLRPPARPQRVFDPRRGVPDPRARGPGGRARDARGGADRPRLARRLGRPLQGRRGPGDQADRRLRGLRRRRPPFAHARLRAPDPAGRVERRLLEPDQAQLARLPRGLLHEAARRLGAARAPLERPDRALRLPLRPRLQGARGEPAEGRRRRPRPAGTGVRARQHLRRAPERGPRRPAARQPRAREARGRGEAAARRHRRRPLPHRRRRLLARGAALHPVGRLAQEPESLALRHERVLFQDAGGDGARLPRPRGRDAADARGRRALLDRDRARQHPAARSSRPRTAATRSSTSSSCASRGSSAATTR